MGNWKISLFAAVSGAILLGGCAAPVTREAVIPARETVQPLPISAAEVEARTAGLARRMEQTTMGEKEKQVAMTLLNSYQMIGATLQPPLSEGDRQRIIRLLFESLSKMDDEYFLKESLDETAYSKILHQYSSKRGEIIQDYLADDHEKVVGKTVALRDLFGEGVLTPDIGLLFSISLAKQGRLREAIIQGEKVLKELDRKPDLVNLRAYILEWQLAMGQEKSAHESLKELIQRVDEKGALVAEAKKRLGLEERPEEPESRAETLTPSGGTDDSPAASDAGSLERPLSEARDLIAKREYTKAKFLLLQQRIRFPEGPETEAIDQVMREVEIAQEGGDEERSQQGAEKAALETEQLNLAKKLVEEENFEEALVKLNEIQQGGRSSAEINSLKDTALEKHINKERNRAARLYLMAKNEGDLRKKEELLVSSFNILKSLLDKYPSSPLNKKINENMSTIRDEMGRTKKKTAE